MRRLLPALLVLILLPAVALHAQTAHVGPDYLYPDPSLTSGEVFDGVTANQICILGYSRSVRDVTATERRAVYAKYGFEDVPGQYEVDHFVPLELGSDNALANLWPEPYASPGAHEKDRVENYLHNQVCAGSMDLTNAQIAIVSDWYAVYLSLGDATDTAAPDVSSAPAPEAPRPVPPPAAAHTWYTSSATNATTYYCDDDPEWQQLSPRNLQSFPSVAALLAVYPGKHLHRPCRDGAIGP